jgi:hypothetical protein
VIFDKECGIGFRQWKMEAPAMGVFVEFQLLSIRCRDPVTLGTCIFCLKNHVVFPLFRILSSGTSSLFLHHWLSPDLLASPGFLSQSFIISCPCCFFSCHLFRASGC